MRAGLARTYLPAAPILAPVVDRPPRAVIAHGAGKFNNPDDLYEHVHYTTTRANLVVTAQTPTYQSDSFTPVNGLAQPATDTPEVLYGSLCVALKGLHTVPVCAMGGSLPRRKQSLHDHRVARPVAGYLNYSSLVCTHSRIHWRIGWGSDGVRPSR